MAQPRKMFTLTVALFGLGALAATTFSDADASGINPSKCDSVSENLVVNCGFETGTFSGWMTSGDLCFCSVSVRSRLTGTFGADYGPPGEVEYLSQLVPTTAGQKYALTFGLRNTGQPNVFQVFWDGSLVFDLVDAPDFPWTNFRLEGLVAAEDGTELRFGFYNPSDGWFIDDIVVAPYPE